VNRNPFIFHTDEMKTRMWRLFDVVLPLLSESGLTYWLDRGTLLGGYREESLIVGDYDIDVRIMQKDWLEIYRYLECRLPGDLTVSAMHHGNKIREPDEDHETMWFRNEDGEFPVAGQEGEVDGTAFHTATALVVHFSDAEWNLKPNFDLYSCRINQHHDCMPGNLPRPWEEDGIDYLCVPSRRQHTMFVPVDYVFPLSSVRVGSRDCPAPGRTETYLRHLFGYIGKDAKSYNEDTGYWEYRP
jgi:hypothetical protein